MKMRWFGMLLVSILAGITYGAAPSRVIGGSLFESSSPISVDQWHGCSEIPVLGQVCVGFAINPSNFTVHLVASIGNETLYTKNIEGGTLCATNEALLFLASSIPGLQQSAHIVEEILLVEKYLPAEAFNLCVTVNEFNLKPFHACTMFDAHVLCWKGSCAWKGEKDYGCVHHTPTID